MRQEKNIVWHDTSVKKQDRESLLKQNGVVLWFTGMSGSGKSTIANALERKLFQTGRLTYLLDGDNIRHGLNKDLGFTASDRTENIRRIAEVSKLFVDAGIITMTAFISPFREDRDSVRYLLREQFIEIFVDCALDVCEDRDPKGLYKMARSGKINNFTGIDSPYEKPLNPEIILHSDTYGVHECVDQIINYVSERKIITQ